MHLRSAGDRRRFILRCGVLGMVADPDDLNPQEVERRREAALKTMLATPPAPRPKPKVSPRPPATKAEQSKYKRSDKTSFKPAPRKT
jgi:hypothetical protein